MTSEKYQPYLDAISSCRLLDGLNPEEIRRMGQLSRFEDFDEGEDILTEGNQYQGLWLVLSGQCRVIKQGERTDSVLATLEPGHVFGEMSFFESAPHSATVRAGEPVKALCLTREQFEKLRSSAPLITEKIAINIIKLLSDRLRRMDHWTCELVECDEHSKHHQEWHEFRARLYSDVFD